MPLRRRNIAGLQIGRNLIDVNGTWMIALDATETKTRAPIEIAWPGELAAPLVTYLTIHRPYLSALLGAGPSRSTALFGFLQMDRP